MRQDFSSFRIHEFLSECVFFEPFEAEVSLFRNELEADNRPQGLIGSSLRLVVYVEVNGYRGYERGDSSNRASVVRIRLQILTATFHSQQDGDPSVRPHASTALPLPACRQRTSLFLSSDSRSEKHQTATESQRVFHHQTLARSMTDCLGAVTQGRLDWSLEATPEKSQAVKC